MVIVISLGISMLLYREKFRFWDYPLSSLEGLKTINGEPNS
jgi:hypothetical protein